MGVRAPEREAEPELSRPRGIGPPATAAVGLAVVLLALLVSNGRPIGPSESVPLPGRQDAAIAGKAVASVLSSACAALLFLGVGRRHSAARARLASVFLALGTTLWATSQSWSPWPLAAALAALALLWMARADEGDDGWAARVGLPLGLLIAAQPVNLALALALAIGVVARWPARAWALLLWALPGIALALLRERIFGQGEGFWHTATTGDWGLSHLSLLVSPGKGLLVFAPVAIVGAVGLARAFRQGDRWLPATFGAGFLAHWLAVGFRSNWLGDEAWGPVALTSALPLLLAFVPEGLEALPRLGIWLGAIAIGVQALGAFAYDQRWERLYQDPPRLRHAELWDVDRSPVVYYARRRVLIFALPAWRDGRAYVRRHPVVLFGPHGSRASFRDEGVVVSGAEANMADVHLQGAARVEGEGLRLRRPGDALFLRVQPAARQRPLQLRVSGRGRGALLVGESTFWSEAPRFKQYPVAGELRLRHAYDFRTSGGADIVVTLARAGDVLIRSVSLVGPGDAEDPIELGPPSQGAVLGDGLGVGFGFVPGPGVLAGLASFSGSALRHWPHALRNRS